MVFFSGKGKFLILFVHGDCGTAGYAACAHSSCNHGRMACHSASHGQDALRHFHSFNIFGRGFQSYQNHLFASCRPCFCILGGKHDFTAGCAGRCCQGFCNGGCSRKCFRVKLGVKQGVQVSGLNHGNCLLLCNHSLVYQITCNLKGRLCGSLAVSGLEHVKVPVLNGKLHILHVSVMVFQFVADIHKLSEHFGHGIL